MCKVRDIEECEKKIFIYLKDGRCYATDWFSDDERKSYASARRRFTEKEQKYIEYTMKIYGVAEEEVERWVVSRNKSDEDCVYISHHAFDRMKQRNGWNKKTSLRMIKKVYDNGLTSAEAPAEYRTWLRKKEKKEPETTYKLYGDMVYVFNNRVLITAMQANKMVYGAGYEEEVEYAQVY